MSRARPRRTVARHGRLTSPHPISQVLRVVGVLVAVVLVSTTATAGYAAASLATQVVQNSVEIQGQDSVPPDIGAIEGGVKLLLVGTDECEAEIAHLFENRCSGEDSEGQLNDVTMLVHISDAPRRVTVVSFPRDLMIPYPECTDQEGYTSSAMSKEQINAAWSYGGLNCVVQVVQELSGEQIQFAAKVSFGNVINITDAIGGVEVCIGNGGMRDPHTGIDWAAGTRNVQGFDALQFLRTRYGVGGSDLARISNQQQYMSRLANKMVSDEVLGDFPTLYRLATAAAHNITPSANLSNPMTLAQIALAVKDVPFDQINFVQYPVFTDPDDENRVVPDWDAADVLWAALAANQAITVGDTGQGVVVADGPTDVPVDQTPAAPEGEGSLGAPESPAPDATVPEPTETAVALPDTVTGTSAAENTCSAGNLTSG